MRSWMIHLAIVLSVCTAVPVDATPQYTVTDLTVQSGLASVVGINNAGQVVGWRAVGQTDPYGRLTYHAAVWSNGQTTDLHPLNAASSIGLGINDAGEVVGQVYVDGMLSHGFLASGGTVRTFQAGTLARAVNASGLIVGGGCLGADGSRPLSWQDVEPRDLETLGGWGGHARDVSATGQIVGESDTQSDGLHAVLWDETGLHDLNDTSALPTGWTLRYATGINDAGQIVGHATLVDGTARAFLWQDGTVRDLGVLWGGSSANGVNAAGQVVGWMGGGGRWDSIHGFHWQAGVMHDLNDLVNLPTDWWVGTAYGINDAGQIICDVYGDGMQRAALLTPVPEPMTVAFLLVGLSLMPGVRRSR